MRRLWGAILFLCAFAVWGAEDLKSWLDDPELWQKEAEQLQKKFAKSLVWRDGNKQELYCPAASSKNFSYGDHPVYDLVLKFKENRLNAISFAIFSRGDFKMPTVSAPAAAPAKDEEGKKKKRKSDAAREERRKKAAAKEEAKKMQAAMETHFKTTAAAVRAELKARFKAEPEQNLSRFSSSRKTELLWRSDGLTARFTIGSSDDRTPEYLLLTFSAPETKPLPQPEKEPSPKKPSGETPPPAPPESAAPAPVPGKNQITKEILRSRVKVADGEHSLDLPMVDQGSKGFCVPATILRILVYYDIPMGLHELAQLLNTDPVRGTSVMPAVKKLKEIDGRLGVHFVSLYQADFYDEDFAERFKRRYNQAAKRMDVPQMGGFASPKFYYPLYHRMRANSGQQETFFRKVRHAVDNGIPLCWSVYYFEPKAKSADAAPAPEAPPAEDGKKKSKKDRAAKKLKQVPPAAGHLRLITGYKEDPRGVFYSDSWGKGSEKVFMELDEAWTITTMLFLLVPNR